jgi:hypothetical protein
MRAHLADAITAPKQLLIALNTGHARSPEQIDAQDAWLAALLHLPTLTAARTDTSH